MDKTQIIISGITILEPVTTLTDLVIAAVCFYAWFKLNKKSVNNIAFKYYNYFFLTMGIATLIGGIIGHGFLYAFEFKGHMPEWASGSVLVWLNKAALIGWKIPGWLTSMISIWLLERASIEYAKQKINNKSFIKFLKVANIIELVTFMFLAFYTLNFRFVEIHSGFGLLAINLPLHTYIYYTTKQQASKIILWAIFASVVSAIVFKNQISIDKWFNHYDISHIFMALSAYIFYKAAKYLIPSEKLKVQNNYKY